MADLKSSSYYSAFVDVYKFFSKFINGSPAGSYTDQWIQEAEEEGEFIAVQYGEEPLVTEMCKACVSEMTRKLDYIQSFEKSGKALPAGINVNIRESRYWKAFQDFWKFFEKYYNELQGIDVVTKDADDLFWKRSCDEARELGYQNGKPLADRFMQDLLLAAMNELESEENRLKKAA